MLMSWPALLFVPLVPTNAYYILLLIYSQGCFPVAGPLKPSKPWERHCDFGGYCHGQTHELIPDFHRHCLPLHGVDKIWSANLCACVERPGCVVATYIGPTVDGWMALLPDNIWLHVKMKFC